MLSRKWIICGFAALALAATGSPALALGNISPVNASYTFSSTFFCQVEAGGNFANPGKYGISTGSATFGASSVQVSTSLISGPIANNGSGLAMTQPTTTYSWSVSNANGTLTIGNVVYDVVYDNVNVSGQPGTIWGTGMDPQGCARSLVGTIVTN